MSSHTPEEREEFLKKNVIREKNCNNAGNGRGCSNNSNNSNSSGNNHHQHTNFCSSSSNAGNSMAGEEYKHASNSEYYELRSKISRLTHILIALVVIAVIAVVIIIITFSVLYAKLHYNLAHHTHKPKVGEQIAAILDREELCVPCNDFRLGPSPEEERMLQKFKLKDTASGQSCCVDEPGELVDLMKMFVERRFRQEIAKGTVRQWPRASQGTGASGQKPAAHLLMTRQNAGNIKEVAGRQYTIDKWEVSEDLTFLQMVTYRHGRLVIPEDGYYFVYSQIAFLEVFSSQDGGSNNSGSPSLSHYIYRTNMLYTRGGDEKLAQNSMTKCWAHPRTFGEYTSYLGAVFYLRNADEIFVKVSNLSMIVDDPKLSYFGLFKI